MEYELTPAITLISPLDELQQQQQGEEPHTLVGAAVLALHHHNSLPHHSDVDNKKCDGCAQPRSNFRTSTDSD